MVELRGEDLALFASDVHLEDRDPATADLFFGALAREAPSATHLFLLGDLFEAWVGDDDPSGVGERMRAALAALAAAGTRVWLMRGNRDFLLGTARFSERCSATMLDDPSTITLFGRRTLLAHGDALCTDDLDYQAFRTRTRTRAWQSDFLARPLAERVDAARALRERSTTEKAAKSEALMDVNLRAVEAALDGAGADILIHGHTHRPAHHRVTVSGTMRERWVLPDWSAADGRGGMLAADRDGLRRVGHWP